MSGAIIDKGAIVPRPRAEERPYYDPIPRKQCTICCALYGTAVTGAVMQVISTPSTVVQYLFYKGDVAAVTWRRAFLLTVDRLAFLSLPFMGLSFTHNAMLSHAMWSKNRKSLWEINWQSLFINAILWLGISAGGCYVSRYVIPKYSHFWRLQNWDYSRARVKSNYRYWPHFSGTFTENHGIVNQIWAINVYTITCMLMTISVDIGGSQYSMDRDNKFMTVCSPRWREWSEVKLRKELFTVATSPSEMRWGRPIIKDHSRQ